MGLGAADVVPGVSGGTIAFITGIYEELLSTISNVNLGLLKTWKTDGFKAAWNKANGNFLLALLSGIFMSVLLLANIISGALNDYPLYVWSFFFGLIVASIPFMGKQVGKWTVKSVFALIIGTTIAYAITILPAASGTHSSIFLFISGAIAICAMILPGISGSFILLLLGSYQIIMEIISNRDFGKFGIFAIGCIVGLLAFSKLLNWLFKHHKDIVIALLTGFLIGSLNKIWPWKETTKSIIHKGEEKAIEQLSIAPNMDDLPVAIGCAIAGFLVIFLMERIAVNKPST